MPYFAYMKNGLDGTDGKLTSHSKITLIPDWKTIAINW
jgi:hypothetical protein